MQGGRALFGCKSTSRFLANMKLRWLLRFREGKLQAFSDAWHLLYICKGSKSPVIA